MACETLVSSGIVIIAGEITTKAQPNYQEIARQTIQEIGYDDSALGFDYGHAAFFYRLINNLQT